MSNGGSSRSSSSSSFHFLAGLSSGVLSAILLQPADLLKTRVQQSQHTTLRATIAAIIAEPHPIRTFWRGTVPSVVRTGVGSALYFSSLNALRERVARGLHGNHIHGNVGGGRDSKRATGSSALPKLSPTANLLTGALARTWAGLVMMPVTVLKVRYESSVYSAQYTSLPVAAAHLLRTEGLRGFFAGFGATAVRDAPYAGLYVLFYEGWKGRLGRFVEAAGTRKTESWAASINFASAMLSSVLATALTNPFDAIKTRIQLFPARYANMSVAARSMLREEGARSLFDGLGLRIARKGLSSALAWTVYEEIIRRAERKWEVTAEA